MATNLTASEKALLHKIIHDDFQDASGEDVIDNQIWAEGIAETKAEGGTLASLIQKEYVDFIDRGSKRENLLCINRAGYDAYQVAE